MEHKHIYAYVAQLQSGIVSTTLDFVVVNYPHRPLAVSAGQTSTPRRHHRHSATPPLRLRAPSEPPRWHLRAATPPLRHTASGGVTVWRCGPLRGLGGTAIPRPAGWARCARERLRGSASVTTPERTPCGKRMGTWEKVCGSRCSTMLQIREIAHFAGGLSTCFTHMVLPNDAMLEADNIQMSIDNLAFQTSY